MPRGKTRRLREKQRGGRTRRTRTSRSRRSGTVESRDPIENVQNSTLTPREKKLKELFKKMWAQHVNALLESRALNPRERGILRLARQEMRETRQLQGSRFRGD
jgi:hypothetical protein